MAVCLRQSGRQPPGSGGLWDDVLELTKLAQAKNSDPLLWAIHLNSTLTYAGVALPSTELADLLVSHICWGNHVPITWKYLEQALAIKLAPPFLVLALLSSRVIPYRQLHPAAYMLYMELLKRHVLLLSSQTDELIYQSTMTTIDEVLHLSQIFGVQSCEPGVLLVEFVFSIVWQLLDASLDDEGLMDPTIEYKSRWHILHQDMDVDGQDLVIEKKTERSEALHKENTTLAIEMIGEFLQNKKTSRILFLARQNMPSHWASFIEGLRLLSAKSAVLRNAKLVTPDVLLYLTADKCENFSGKIKAISRPESHAVMASSSLFSSAGQSVGARWSSLWIPIDLFLEDAMDGSKVGASSAVEHLASLVKALQAVHGTSWHDAFLGLWIASLRLVQRERDPSEGPVPRLDTCLCMLLSITTLAITSIIEEEEGERMEEADRSPSNQKKDNQELGNRRKDLITSLQQLGNYDALLSPPQSVCSAANQAAAKAIMFVSGLGVSNGYHECVSVTDMPINCSGNMWHLIVEACIARNLLDTSAYFWPGYVNVRISQMPHGVPNPSCWSSLMKGSPLTPSMVNALVATPASSLAEIEKIFEIALNGSNEEKISAATILCGASIIRGWNIQEHTILFISRLLSPSAPADKSESDSYLVSCAPFLYVLLVGISSVDCVQIFSLHGLIPLLAGQLIPICEVFGSTAPNASWTLTTGDEISCHAVFSIAFMLLLRLWRFDHPPLENVKKDGPPMGLQLTPEFLLLVRNSQFATFGNLPKDRLKAGRLSKILSFPMEPLFIDSFPKLKIWYQQHQQCIASILSGLVPGTPVHQIVDALLTMMFRKINRPGQPLNSTSSGSSNPSGSATEDINNKLRVPAWDILEATPFVLDAALTACAHGRLSPRGLATGLKDLADFLPASLATIVSYFGAEVTRGVWKPAFMNGTDWPSPAANLSSIEQQIKKILAATGVDVPSLPVGGSSPATLPLPLAALISLTITYKLDKATERCLTLVGPSLNSLAASCPWPCTPVMASLWTQKVKRWSDFLVFSSSRTVFQRSNDALIQLLKSCFHSTLGLNTSHIHSNGGVGALLGHGFGSHFSGGISPVAPGILYLRVHRSVRDCLYIAEEIVSLLMLSVQDISTGGLPKDKAERLKKNKSEMRYGEVSLASAMIWVKVAASLAASLVWISGGSALVLSLIKETLPSWFLSVENAKDNQGRDFGGMAATLSGYALAYFVVFCITFSFGVDSNSPASKRRGKILGAHMDFLASALDGKITLGCSEATWRAYVLGFVRLIVDRPLLWLEEVELDVLKRLTKGLKQQLNEEALALSLLQKGGFGAMGAAAELIIQGGF